MLISIINSFILRFFSGLKTFLKTVEFIIAACTVPIKITHVHFLDRIMCKMLLHYWSYKSTPAMYSMYTLHALGNYRISFFFSSLLYLFALLFAMTLAAVANIKTCFESWTVIKLIPLFLSRDTTLVSTCKYLFV